MRRTSYTLLIPLVVGLAASAGAWAQATDPAFARMDSNHDSRISGSEHAAATLARFTQMDADHDGKLTAAELAAAREATQGEAPDSSKAVDVGSLFEALDTDHDGKVSTAEMEAAHTRPPGHGAAIVKSATPAAKVPATLTGVAASMDGNHDGVISAEEYAVIGHARFDRIDRNHDGFVTIAEWQASHGGGAPPPTGKH
jgi:Ca2+-binding EF-hand superfamily protein